MLERLLVNAALLADLCPLGSACIEAVRAHDGFKDVETPMGILVRLVWPDDQKVDKNVHRWL